MSQNFYFDLTREFNAEKCVALLSSSLEESHARLCRLAADLLPQRPLEEG